MAITTISRYGFTDDTGDGESGDVWNGTLIGASIYDKIDAILAADITSGGALRIGWAGDSFSYTQTNALTIANNNAEALGVVGTSLTNLNMYLKAFAARVTTLQGNRGGTQGGQLVVFCKPDSVADVVEVARFDHNKTTSLQGGLAFAANAGTNPGAGGIYKASAGGVVVNTATGSVFDLQIVTPSLASTIVSVATGTQNVKVYGSLEAVNSYAGRAGAGGTLGNAFNIFWTGSVAQLWIDSTNVGNLTITSDARHKKAIQPIGVGLAEICDLQPRRFRWARKEDPPELQFGLIAQEVADVLPEIVHHMPGLASAKAKEGLYRVDYVALVPVLVRAVQELAARVTTLEAAA